MGGAKLGVFMGRMQILGKGMRDFGEKKMIGRGKRWNLKFRGCENNRCEIWRNDSDIVLLRSIKVWFTLEDM